MSRKIQYSNVVKYLVTAICIEPLHIGSAMGEEETVLIHPVDGIPFVQASSLAGVFRNYYEKRNGFKEMQKLFGVSELSEKSNASEHASRVSFSDGTFEHNVTLELRPRVKLNPISGTCDTSVVSGTEENVGHKFQTEYIGAGAKFTFEVYLYDIEKQEKLEEIFSALSQGIVQIGGQKSNGCGYLQIEKLYLKEFNLKNEEGREDWANEDSLSKKAYTDVTKEICENHIIEDVYEFKIYGKTENELLIKSIAVTEYGKNTPGCMNIQNAKKQYIVPASSLKGAIKSQMKKIAGYLHCESLISEAFGTGKEKDTEGIVGCLRFYDTVVGEKEENDKKALSHRIHIDKFTGGVMHGSLFTEKNVFGAVHIRIGVKQCENRDKICAILLMALRDLAIGTMSIGGGANVGKGIIEVSSIQIQCPKEQVNAEIDFVTGNITDETNMIGKYMKALEAKK